MKVLFIAFLISITGTVLGSAQFSEQLISEGAIVTCYGEFDGITLEVGTYGRETKRRPFGINNTLINLRITDGSNINATAYLHKGAETITEALDGGGFMSYEYIKGFIIMESPEIDMLGFMEMNLVYFPSFNQLNVQIIGITTGDETYRLSCDDNPVEG